VSLQKKTAGCDVLLVLLLPLDIIRGTPKGELPGALSQSENDTMPFTSNSDIVCVLACAACLALEQRLQRQLVGSDLAAAQELLSSSSSRRSTAAGPYQEAAEQLLAALVSGSDEFAPVCAVLGGVIANNVVTSVSRAGAPLNNLLYFTLFDGRAIVETQPAAGAAAVALGGDLSAGAGHRSLAAQQRAENDQQQHADSVVIDD
jgi:hypothetical protein